MRIAIVFLVVFAALSLLGLEFLSDSLNGVILYLPRVFVALALLIAGVVLGQIVRRQVDRLAQQMDLPGPLGMLTETVVLGVFAVTALAQLGIPTQVLLLLAAILLGAMALTLALAFGIGGREMAREVSARATSRGPSASARRSASAASAGVSRRSRRPAPCSRRAAATACGSPTHSSWRRS